MSGTAQNSMKRNRMGGGHVLRGVIWGGDLDITQEQFPWMPGTPVGLGVAIRAGCAGLKRHQRAIVLLPERDQGCASHVIG